MCEKSTAKGDLRVNIFELKQVDVQIFSSFK